MAISEEEAFRRLDAVARTIDPRLKVDRAWVFYREGSFPGFEFGIQFGQARTVLFMPEGDIDGEGWEERLKFRLEAVYRYLSRFPTAPRAKEPAAGKGSAHGAGGGGR
ncbi:MAG: hypothetical protein QN189_03640 [Armatimonadota bacterium]|nr:hypothetical protein [Armatimonadota bacterium]